MTGEEAIGRISAHDMTHFPLHTYFICSIEMYSYPGSWSCFISGALTKFNEVHHIPGANTDVLTSNE